jgi:hypothetical protein
MCRETTGQLTGTFKEVIVPRQVEETAGLNQHRQIIRDTMLPSEPCVEIKSFAGYLFAATPLPWPTLRMRTILTLFGCHMACTS